MPRVPTPPGQPFKIRKPGNPLGADYDIEGNCWIWKWGTTPDGTPQAQINGEKWLVTRWLKRNELQPGLIVRHKPGIHDKPGIKHNPSCIRPSHLIVGTSKENMEDRIIDGTDTYTQGPKTYLTTKQVIEIYLRLLKGEKQSKLAREYGVHKSTIFDIKKGRSWTEVIQKVKNKIRKMREERKKAKSGDFE